MAAKFYRRPTDWTTDDTLLANGMKNRTARSKNLFAQRFSDTVGSVSAAPRLTGQRVGSNVTLHPNRGAPVDRLSDKGAAFFAAMVHEQYKPSNKDPANYQKILSITELKKR